jgi:hypothetical protein
MRNARRAQNGNRSGSCLSWLAPTQHRLTGLLICAAWFGGLLTSGISPAAAQSLEACKALDTQLIEIGKATGAYDKELKAAQANNSPTPDNDRIVRLAIEDLAQRASPFRVELSSPSLSGGDSAWVRFTDKRIAAITDANAGKICVKAYSQADRRTVPIQQIFLFEDPADHVKRLKVVFTVAELPNNPMYGKINYVFIGALADTTPPTVFSYSTRVSVASRSITGLVAGLFALVAYLLLVWTTYDDDVRSKEGFRRFAYALNPIRITVGMFGNASVSQIQVVLFTLIVAGLLFQLWLRTGMLSDISKDLLILIGISAVGAGGARFTATLKTDISKETAHFLLGKGWYNWDRVPPREHVSLAELLRTDGRLDVYKFQMAIFTVVVALYVLTAGQTDLGEVKISETMLYLIGISQGVFVGGQAVTDRTTDLENSVKKMVDLQKQVLSLTREIEMVPPPTNLAELQHQREARSQEYAEAATIAVEEFSPLLHRKYPREFDAQGNVVIADGKEKIHPDVLKPDYH